MNQREIQETLRPKTMQEYQAKLLELNPCCRWCHVRLSHEVIRSYKHPGGFKVLEVKDVWNQDVHNMTNIVRKRWLYVKCPSCGYDWALWKLGVKK